MLALLWYLLIMFCLGGSLRPGCLLWENPYYCGFYIDDVLCYKLYFLEKADLFDEIDLAY